MIRCGVGEDEHHRAQRTGDHKEGFGDLRVGRYAESAENKRQQRKESAGAKSDKSSHPLTSKVLDQRAKLSGVPGPPPGEGSGSLTPQHLHTAYAGAFTLLEGIEPETELRI